MSDHPADNPQIGKDVIESLTIGMYDDCRCIYREYIQNAADAVDKAVEQNLIRKGEDEIHVSIDRDTRSIAIEDNATGIARDSVMPILRNIARSTKKRGEDKGFRGIGRLGGLGYCSRLVFETSCRGEKVKSVMVWNAEKLRQVINKRDNHEDAAEVLEMVTSIETFAESSDAHYFKVTLKNVSADELLQVSSVREYLGMVAPVDISSAFLFRGEIRNFMSRHNLSADTYNIYVNGDQIYKPYTSAIYEDHNGGKRKVDDIIGVKFLLRKSEDCPVMYWGWYSISGLKGQMKPINVARGIRLRKENIQIGGEEICKKFFSRTDDQRFSFYYFGEIHAVWKKLIPNSRRDYFGESPECAAFEREIKKDFLTLKELCYDVQKLRSSCNTISKGDEMRAKIEEKEKNGYTSQKEKEELKRRLEEHEKKETLAKKQLDKVKEKIQSEDSPLQPVLSQYEVKPAPKDYPAIAHEEEEAANVVREARTKYRTDKPIYSKFSRKDKKLIAEIYTAIANAIADEKMREAVICSVEQQITR